MRKKYTFEDIITEDTKVLDLIKLAKKIAPSDATVLITGESGTGKELFARAIHNESQRANRDIIALNCAAVPDTLLESELFGHEKGSFTGAIATRKGKFELAHKSTLFLDEIGDMSPSAQAKILRVIEERSLERIGGEVSVSVDIRIITATNVPLLEHVQKGLFRNDLYYRLNEVHLHLPTLNDRKEDIPILVKHFIQVYNKQYGKRIKGISDAALEYLFRHNWPGNLRELNHVLKCAMLLVEGDTLWMEHIPVEMSVHGHGEDVHEKMEMRADSLMEILSLEEVEKRHIMRILEFTNWNKSQTSKILQTSRPTLDRKIVKYDLDPIRMPSRKL